MEAFRTRDGWKTRTDVTVLKVIAPDRFLIKEAPNSNSQMSKDFSTMEKKLQQFMLRRDMEPVIPLLPEIGASVLVRRPKESEWFRARVCRILDTISGYEIEVTLVDYGDTFIADRRFLRVVPDALFSAVPFQCIEFLLPGLVPLTLMMDVETKLELKQSKNWDTAALEHVKSVFNGIGAIQVRVRGETRSGGLFGDLYFRRNEEFVSLADDLLQRKYASLDMCTPNPELLVEQDKPGTPERCRKDGAEGGGPSPVSGSLASEGLSPSWLRREQERALSIGMNDLLGTAPISPEASQGEGATSRGADLTPTVSPTPPTSPGQSLLSESPFSDTSTLVSSVRGLGRGVAALLEERQPGVRSGAGPPASSTTPDTGTRPGRIAATSGSPVTQTSETPLRTESGSSTHSPLLSNLGMRLPTPSSPADGAATDLGDGSMPRRSGDDAANLDVSGRVRLQVESLCFGRGIKMRGSSVSPQTSSSEPRYGPAPGGSEADIDDTMLAKSAKPNLAGAAFGTGKSHSHGSSSTSSGVAAPTVVCLGRGLQIFPRPSTKSPGPFSESQTQSQFEDIHEELARTEDTTRSVPVVNLRSPSLVTTEASLEEFEKQGTMKDLLTRRSVPLLSSGGGDSAPLSRASEGALQPATTTLHSPKGKEAARYGPTPHAEILQLTPTCPSPSLVTTGTSLEESEKGKQLKDLLRRRSVPLPSSGVRDSVPLPGASEGAVHPATTTLPSPMGKEATQDGRAPEAENPQLTPTGPSPSPSERLRDIFQAAKASSGSVHSGCKPARSKCSEENPGLPPRLEEIPQPPSSMERPDEDDLEPLRYDDFMKLYSFDAEDTVNSEEEERKWSLKFSALGDHQELIQLNSRREAEDIRRQDLQSFSNLPSDLEPYMEFEVPLDFSTVFVPSHWSSLVHSRTVRALRHGAAVPRAIVSLDQMPFREDLKARLGSLGFCGPSCIQSAAWPAVHGGRTVIAVGSPHSGKTLSYLLPLVSMIATDLNYRCLPRSSGPLVLVLSSTWRGAQRIYDQFMLLTEDCKAPKCGVLYAGGSEADKEAQLVNGVDILIATPLCLLRVMRKYDYTVVNLKRCCHLVLDDGERLVEEFTDEVREVFKEYVKALHERVPCGLVSQVVVCSTRWTAGLASLLRKLQVHSPVVLFSSFAEAAIYAKVPTFVRFVDCKARDSSLIELLDGNRGRKTVVCTSSYDSALSVHRLLQSESMCALLLHDKLPMANVRSVSSEWAAMHAPVLIAQDSVLSWAGVSDAVVLIHYDIPELSRFNFGFRFSCLAERMRSFDAKGEQDPRDAPLAHLILTRDNARLSVQLVEFLKAIGAKVPPAFEQLADEERQRRSCNPELPLCLQLKSFGRCMAPQTTGGTTCRNRHSIVPALDCPRDWNHLPTSGEVRIFVTRVEDATRFYAWVLEHWDPTTVDRSTGKGKAVLHTKFLEAMLEMNAYFAAPGADRHIRLTNNENPTVGGVYGLEVDADQFRRVQVVSILPESGGSAPPRVEVFHIDHGGKSTTASRCLLQLPERLARLPPFAVEVFCCRVQPQDRDVEWTFQAECSSHSLVTEKELVGKVVLCLGGTLWLDPLVKRKHLDKIDLTVIERHVRSCLLSQGMACDNPEHVTQLRKLAADAGLDLPSLAPPAVKEQRASGSVPRYAFLDPDLPNYVYVWNVVSPDLFYVQLHKFTSCLEKLEDDIKKHMSEGEAVWLDPAHVGDPCIARFKNNRWYRACVERMADDGNVEVFFPDYGDTALRKLDEIYALPPEMLLLPFQGIQCRLAGIAPLSDQWTPEASSAFENYGFTADEENELLPLTVLGRTGGLRQGSSCYEVLLFQPKGGRSVNISDELVKRGLARSSALPVPELETDALLFQPPVPVPASEQVSEQDSSPPESEPDNDPLIKLSKEKLDEHMGKLYSHIIDTLVPVMEKEVAGLPFLAEGEAVPEYEETSAVTPPVTPQQTVDQREAPKVASAARFPPLKSVLLSPSGRQQPTLWWWEDMERVYVEVRLGGIEDYQLQLEASSFYLRFRSEGVEYAAHESLHALILVTHSKLEARGNVLQLILVKQEPAQIWNFLTAEPCKVRYIRYNFERLVDSDEEVEDHKIYFHPDYVRSDTPVPYDKLAHEERLMELEELEEQVHAPLEVYNTQDPNNLFSSF